MTTKFITALGDFIRQQRPRDRWYYDAFWLSGCVAKVVHAVRPQPTDGSLRARMLHRLLDLLARDGDHFPIPVTTRNAELFDQYLAMGGFVLCTAHVPLIKTFVPWMRSHVDPKVPIKPVVKFPGPDGKVPVWNGDPIEVIAADASVLLHTRSLLRQGGVLLLLTDKEQGEYISSNIFRFVGKMRSRVIMCFPLLRPDGTILLDFMKAPAPECRNEADVRANLDFLAQVVRSVLTGTSAPVAAAQAPQPEFSLAERTREIERIQLYSRRQLVLRARRLYRLLHQPDIRIADRELYEKRLRLMEAELEHRSHTFTRTEVDIHGNPLPDPGSIEDDPVELSDLEAEQRDSRL